MVSSRRFSASQSSISSNSRGSRLATSIVKTIRASGSIAQRSNPAILAETPICAHWRQANSRNPCRTLSLSSESSIFDPQGIDSFLYHHPVPPRRILGHRPVRRRNELLRGWMRPSQIRLVAPAGLIDHCEELKVDLVQPSGEVNSKGLAIAPHHHASHEAIRETPL